MKMSLLNSKLKYLNLVLKEVHLLENLQLELEPNLDKLVPKVSHLSLKIYL